jgi:hypothetical protein
MTTTTTNTKLEWRISQEAPDLDMETDLYICTADDGTPIYAPTSPECARARRQYEREEWRSLEDLQAFIYRISSTYPSLWMMGGRPRIHSSTYDFVICQNPASGLWRISKRIR